MGDGRPYENRSFFVLEGIYHRSVDLACSPIEALLCTISISEQYLILWNRLQLAFIICISIYIQIDTIELTRIVALHFSNLVFSSPDILHG